MSGRRMDWRKARLHGKPTLDHRDEFGEFRVRDRADYWLRKCFQVQRARAKQRGIPFAMTYEEWLRTWNDSGHLHQRGTRSGNFVLGRRGDVGGYASSNVEIVSIQQNTWEAAQHRKLRRQALTAPSTDWATASSTASRAMVKSYD
jgi:hypothetical protein